MKKRSVPILEDKLVQCDEITRMVNALINSSKHLFSGDDVNNLIQASDNLTQVLDRNNYSHRLERPSIS